MDAVIRRIMVPLDGSLLAESVLTAAVSLARHLEARLTLLHVMERAAPTSVHGQRHLAAIGEAEEYLEAVAARCRARGIEVDLHVHPNPEGNVPQSIVAHAGALGADLIVLATHGAGGARRAVFGSVAQQVLRRGDRAVMLMHPREASQPDAAGADLELRRLLVPLDGERDAEAALPFAVTLARAYRATIDLLRIVPTLATISGERASAAKLVPTAAAASLEYEEADAQRYLGTIAERLRAAGVAVTWAVARGDAAQGVLEAASGSAGGGGLVIMATHARTGLDAVLTGSVASKVIARYPGPALLVRVPTDFR
jgi:nucleotide-binding universal stress UspA family protein